LLEEFHWQDYRRRIFVPEFKKTLSRDKFIKYIEDKNLEPQIKQIVSDVWDAVEQQCVVHRKFRY